MSKEKAFTTPDAEQLVNCSHHLSMVWCFRRSVKQYRANLRDKLQRKALFDRAYFGTIPSDF